MATGGGTAAGMNEVPLATGAAAAATGCGGICKGGGTYEPGAGMGTGT